MKHPYCIGDQFELHNPMYGISFRNRVTITEKINGKVRLTPDYPRWMEIWVPEGALDLCCMEDYTYCSINPEPLVASQVTRIPEIRYRDDGTFSVEAEKNQHFIPLTSPDKEPQPKEAEEEDPWSDMRD